MQWLLWILALVLAAGAGWLVYTRDKKRALPHPWALSVLRALVVFLTLLLLIAPSITITRQILEKPVIVLLQDNSTSIATGLGADTQAYRKNVANLIQKLGDNYRVVTSGFGGRIRSDSIFTYNLPATDIASAMERVQEAYGAQNLGAVILASDGRYNQGANPLTEESSLHAALYTVAIGDSARHKDLRVIRAYANKVVSVNSSFEVQADIVADLCDGYSNTVSVAEEGHQLASLPVTIRGDRYDHSCSFTIKADKPGLHHYVISLPAAAGESNVANNRRDVFVEVEEQKKQVLIVCAAPHPDVSAVKEALAGMDAYQLTVCTADNCKYDFDRYSAIILHGLPSLGHNFTSMLLHVRKPLWLILGNQASWQVLNDLRPLTGITLAPSSGHN